ncbi:MAG: hypothetical protein U0797_15895 [Gemmataceae bacterium]
MGKRSWFSTFGVVWLALGGVLLVRGGVADAQGRYADVTDADVVALKLNHYHRAKGPGREADFEFSFNKKKEFVIRKGKGPIPADLISKLLPAGTKAEEIRGKWKLEGKSGQRLVLSDIKAGNTDGKKDVSLPIYRTAPTVVRVGEPQYVFAVSR